MRPLAFVLALLAARGSTTAQTPPSFASGVGVVELDVAVARDGRPVPGLVAADFEVRDAGVPQTVELVSAERSRVQAILALDTSGSVAGEKLQQLSAAARAFLAGLEPDDTATLLAFSYRIRLLGEDGLPPAQAAARLGDLRAGGATALVDAVCAATAFADARRGRPVVLVFSDGDDNMSWLTEQAVLDAARESDVVVHAVGFTPGRTRARDALSRESRLPNEKRRLSGSPRFLERLTAATGGRVWYADAPAGLGEVFLSVLEELRSRYLLRFEPRGVATGGWHPLSVSVRGRGLAVRARPGYQATASPAP